MVVGVEGDDSPTPSSCATMKGGELGLGGDKVVVVESGEEENVEDVEGLKIGDKENKVKSDNNADDDEEEENGKDKPILVEGFVQIVATLCCIDKF
ncbi:hypothetical protein LIER_09268 [Lithospermum erythrorhizon]|uniref:Uncharacterized protein n=1 Tax=Lithospermum erythrorhizon TaxID=34254 RepID=A0AAV3PJV7_LITER